MINYQNHNICLLYFSMQPEDTRRFKVHESHQPNQPNQQNDPNEPNNAGCHYPIPYQLCVNEHCRYDARHCEVKDCRRYQQHEKCSKVLFQPYQNIEQQLRRQQKHVRSNLKYVDLQLVKNLEKSFNPRAPRGTRRHFINLRPIKRIFKKILEGKTILGREVRMALLPFQNYDVNPTEYAERTKIYGERMEQLKNQILRLRRQANTNIFTPVIYQDDDDSRNSSSSIQQEVSQQIRIQQPDHFQIHRNHRKINVQQLNPNTPLLNQNLAQLNPQNFKHFLPLQSPHWHFLRANFEKQITFNQKFIASDNRYSAVKFHEVCDGMVNTLTLIRYGNQQFFAAFTPLPFNKSEGFSSDYTRQSKIFWLNKNAVFQLKKQNWEGKNHAICSYQFSGPRFGKDLIITNQCNKIFIPINIGEFYQKPNEEIQKYIQRINDERMFITEYEVYILTFTQKQANGVQLNLPLVNFVSIQNKGNQKQTQPDQTTSEKHHT